MNIERYKFSDGDIKEAQWDDELLWIIVEEDPNLDFIELDREDVIALAQAFGLTHEDL